MSAALYILVWPVRVAGFLAVLLIGLPLLMLAALVQCFISTVEWLSDATDDAQKRFLAWHNGLKPVAWTFSGGVRFWRRNALRLREWSYHDVRRLAKEGIWQNRRLAQRELARRLALKREKPWKEGEA
jgi:hypothetical protein